MNPLIPMLAITGKPTRDRMCQIFEKYKSVGIEQVVLYPRSGCEFTYPSDEWYAFCKMFVSLAADKGLKVWIYDDFNWPSAQMNGFLLKNHPDKASQYICIDANGEYEIRRKNRYSDILDEQIIKEFINNTHQRYFDDFGGYFGDTVVGFFTDEPSFGYASENVDGYISAPYYTGLKEDYEKAFSRSFDTDIKENYENLWSNYYTLLGNRFKKVFIEPVNDWCVSHGTLFSGHMMDESSIKGAVSDNGDLLSVLSEMSQPGIDEIFTGVTPGIIEWETLAALRYATRTGKNGLVELFAVGPSDMPLSKMRQMLCLTSLFGANRFVMTVASVDARGNVLKGQYYNPNNYMQPWFSAFGNLGEQVKQILNYREYEYKPLVQVVYPLSAARKNIKNDIIEQINNEYKNLLITLTKRQIDWEVINEGDPQTADYVLSINDDFAYDRVEDIKPSYPYITDKNGQLLEDIIIKRFKNGKFIALNLRDDNVARPVIVHTESGEIETMLYARGIITEQTEPDATKIGETEIKEFTIKANNKNLLRAVTAEGEYTFVADTDIKVRFVIRNYENSGEILLDGMPIAAKNDCDVLTDGFNQLYSVSDEISLSAGEHKIKAIGVTDYRYLPLTLISGDFFVRQDNHIYEVPEKLDLKNINEALKNYIGSILVEADAQIGNGKNYITADFGGMYTVVRLDGEIIGELIYDGDKVAVPLIYNAGERKLEFEIFTSVAPMFSDVTRFDEIQPLEWWSRYSHVVNCGSFSEIKIDDIKIITTA